VTAAPLAHRVDAELLANPSRVIARLFLPGEEEPGGRSRAGAVVARIVTLPEGEVEQMTEQLLTQFSPRHHRYTDMLSEHASVISSRLQLVPPMTRARGLLVGASFTAEYAVEGAALCNPSAVLHPDQRGLEPGQARLAISVRGIGEGHVSTIGFASALVGPGTAWTFEPRSLPVVAGVSSAVRWQREHLRAVLVDQGRVDELAHGVLSELPDWFSAAVLHDVIAGVHHDLLARPGATETVNLLRDLVASAYEVVFPPDVTMSQQLLLPSIADESNGMEDARFVRFVAADQTVEYRATYTAYNGHQIAPRLLTSPDLRTFRTHPLAGPAARNKGMALFPRLVGGRHLALCRSDGESNWLTESADGFVWRTPELIQAPESAWQSLQVGNCGAPIETDRGWLVLTHGVGPMRRYAIGAILLDLEDPVRVVGRLDRPLLQPTPEEQDGYVPNVVYSCGGVVHDGRLWLPYGIGDCRLGVAWASVEEILDGCADGGAER
jgi:predicted GH43/DUF377 family glycosyl hydrolase